MSTVLLNRVGFSGALNQTRAFRDSHNQRNSCASTESNTELRETEQSAHETDQIHTYEIHGGESTYDDGDS